MKQRMAGSRRQGSRARHGFSDSAMAKIECKRENYEGNNKCIIDTKIKAH